MASVLESSPPLLTVAIPTFERAELLDRQLAWFAEAVRGREEQVELLVADNASGDRTPWVVDAWRERLGGGALRTRWLRRPEDVGAVRNISGCLRAAAGRFVWVVSDDDRLRPDALRFVLDALERRPDLSLLILNFSSRDGRSGELRFERCFEVGADQEAPDGSAIFARHLAHPHPSRWGGLALTTALVYRSAAAREALDLWPEGLSNLTVQLFVTGWCARRGRTLLTEEPWLEAKAGVHYFSEDGRLTFRFRMADVPEAFVRLAAIGYDRGLCRDKLRRQLRELPLRAVVGRARAWPGLTASIALRYLRARVGLELVGRRPSRHPDPIRAGLPDPRGRSRAAG